MEPVILGAGAALCWGSAGAMVSRASPHIGALASVAFVLLAGLVVLLPFLALSGAQDVSSEAAVWLALGGISEVGGLTATYYAFRFGRVGVVGPIASTAGGLTALISAIAGDPISVVQGVAALVIIAGVMLASRSNLDDDGAARNERRSVVVALVGALLVALGMFATGRAGLTLDTAWAILPPRLLGIFALLIALRAGFTFARQPVALATAAGLCEVVGFALFTEGAGISVPTTALLTSLSGIVAASLGFALFKDRLGPVQIVGIGLAAGGVAILTSSTPGS